MPDLHRFDEVGLRPEAVPGHEAGRAEHAERIVFEGPDLSWRAEWDDFVRGICDSRPYFGDVDDGLVAMGTLAALYRSVREQRPINYGEDASLARA